MKRKKTIIILAAAAICPCCCGSSLAPQAESTEDCILNVCIDTGMPPAGKSADICTYAYEYAVNSIQLFIYDSDGSLCAYGSSAEAPDAGLQIITAAGPKTVWAVANAPDMSGSTEISTLEGICKYPVMLEENSIAGGFVMAGSAECTVSPGMTQVSIPVRRFVSRIALRKITSLLPEDYGALAIKNIFLSNVAGSQNLSGTASPAIWYNKAGRADNAADASMIIDGDRYRASCPDLTFRDAGLEISCGDLFSPDIPYLLYCCPNGNSSDISGWEIPFRERKTRLIISAAIAGIDCYYPVTIDFPERNSAYTVELSITGRGSADPDTPVLKGEISASVSIQDWKAGDAYNETI